MSVSSKWAQRTAARIGAKVVFRPRIAIFCAVLGVAVAIVWLVAAARFGWQDLLLQVPVLTFFGLGMYVTCVRPIVAVGDDDVLVRNPLRDVRVPWSALAAIETQYALTLTSNDGAAVRAWAAPAPSRFSASRATPSDIAAIGWDDDDAPPPASADLRSDSGAAAIVVRRAWKSATAHNLTGEQTVSVHWATGLIAALAISFALGVATLSL